MQCGITCNSSAAGTTEGRDGGWEGIRAKRKKDGGKCGERGGGGVAYSPKQIARRAVRPKFWNKIRQVKAHELQRKLTADLEYVLHHVFVPAVREDLETRINAI